MARSGWWWRWRLRSRSWHLSIPLGGRRGSIRWRPCVMNDRADSVLVLKDVKRSFAQGAARLEVLRGVSLAVRRGELVALVGPSGCGKSTLLHIAGLLEQADSGEIWIAGKNGAALPDDQRSALRRDSMGFVYQYHHLLREFSALENIAVPQMIAGRPR